MNTREINAILELLSKKFNFLFIYNDIWLEDSKFNKINLGNFENLTWGFVFQTLYDKKFDYIIVFDNNNYLLNRILFYQRNLNSSTPLLIISNMDFKCKDLNIEKTFIKNTNEFKKSLLNFFLNV